MAFNRMFKGLMLAACTLGSLATAQTADASQSSAVSAAISSYTHSLLTGPVATSIALEVALLVSATELPAIVSGIPTLLPEFTANEDLYSFATNPPTTYATPSWATDLPTSVQNDLEALRTSVFEAEASIVRSVLGVTEAAASATSTGASAAATSTGAAAGMGLSGALMAGGVAAVVGVAAVL